MSQMDFGPDWLSGSEELSFESVDRRTTTYDDDDDGSLPTL